MSAKVIMRDFEVFNKETKKWESRTAANAMFCLAQLEKEAGMSKCVLYEADSAVKVDKENDTPFMIHQKNDGKIIKSWRVVKGVGW